MKNFLREIILKMRELVITHIAIITLTFIVILTPLLWSQLKSAYTSFTNFMSQTVTLTIWETTLISIALVLLLPLITSFLRIFNRETNTNPSPMTYTKDNILGIDWSWSWTKNLQGGYALSQLQARCPKCKSILTFNHMYSPVECINTECDWQFIQPANHHYHYESQIQEKIRHEIDRRLHSGEWSNHSK